MTLPFSPDSPLVNAVLPSPNHGERRSGIQMAGIDMVVLHYTGLATAEAALELLRDPTSDVSCHYVVLEDGTVIQMVSEARRAWHAGVSSWEGITDTNSRSIGIELVNPGHGGDYRDFPPAQIAAAIALVSDIVARYGIRADRVLAHSDVAPQRKDDPGEKFPWDALHRAGIGHLVPEAAAKGGRFFMRGDGGAAVAALQGMLALYGYDIAMTGSYDEATEKVVAAFQRHFRRSRVDGVADASTLTTLRDLIAVRPHDREPASSAGA